MQEDFLHHVWKYQKIDKSNSLKTSQGDILEILSTGQYNQEQSGPDFFNAKIKINSQIWAGNIEIHIKSSDWYIHNHESDKAYDNVILHVVWEDDVEIYRSNRSIIPSISLQELVDEDVFTKYNELLSIKPKTLNCENEFEYFDDFTIQNWLERLYIERLEEKSKNFYGLLKQSKNDWNEVLFILLCKNFGLNKNGEAFQNLAQSIGYKLLSKYKTNLKDLEALFLGQSQLLEIETEETYILDLKSRFKFFKHKHQLAYSAFKPQFFRLRPDNFPTLRLAQLAEVYHQNDELCQQLISVDDIKEIYKIFDIKLSHFWSEHYSLSKKSKPKVKSLHKSFIDLLIINTIVPLKFCYQKYSKKDVDSDSLFSLIRSVKPEKNSKVEVFENLRKHTNTNALHSQGLLQLKLNYCEKNYCLKCHLGKKILNR